MARSSSRSLWTAKLRDGVALDVKSSVARPRKSPAKAMTATRGAKAIILGIDPSLRGTGLAVLDTRGSTPRLLASLTLSGAIGAHAADATTPLDYTQRNQPFSAAPSVTPDKKSPEANATVQDKRVDKTVVDKPAATIGDRRAAIDLKETRDKTILDKDSQRPETVDRTMSAFNHREATISTANESTMKPQMVVKYQDSLTSASATNMARFPALDRATGAKINRFVFLAHLLLLRV